jgi:prepilin-type N-terminal cleavage/methylation domain-containing protein
MTAARRGFSMAELMVVVVLGALIIFALQQALVVQRRYWSAQGGVTQRHEVARVAMAVLTGALREANLATGDVVVLTPGRIRVRMPLGLGLVCGTDVGGQRVGVVAAEGRWAAGVGDSVLVQRAGGWTAEAITSLGGPVPLVPCVPAGGTVATVARPVLDVVKGSALRPFRSLIFEVALDAGAPWLFRADGALSEPLAGPVDGVSGFRAWYEDATGVEVATPALATRVGVRVITARATGVGALNRQDTLILTFGGRNR